MVESRNEKVTIRDVAELAGVSHSTVGRVIGNYGSVSEKARTRVMTAIEKLGYSPNAVAQSLRNKKTNTIAVVVGSIANNFFSKVIGAMENVTTSQGFNLLICSTHEDIVTEVRHLQNLQRKRVDAIIMSSLQTNVSAADMGLYNSEIPIVYIDYSTTNVPHDLLESAIFKGTFQATEYLINLGHRKIGAMCTPQFPTVKQRFEGYCAALKKHGILFEPSLVVNRQYHSENAGREMVKELFLLNDDITALLILNNNLCDSTLLALRDMNKNIPDDISLITWDDTSLNDLLEITTIAQFPELIGKVAALQAIKRVQEVNSGKISQERFVKTLGTEFRIRKSCKAL